MTYVLGLDLSLTSSGLASVEDGVLREARSVPTVGKRADSLTDRWSRVSRIVRALTEDLVGVDLAVVEGPSHGSLGSAVHDLAGLWWTVTGTLIDRGIPVAIAAPSTVKKWATGSGKADKAAMGAAIGRMWPDVDLPNGDVVDAVALASLGAQQLGPVPFVELARHAPSRAAVAWPVGLVSEVAA